MLWCEVPLDTSKAVWHVSPDLAKKNCLCITTACMGPCTGAQPMKVSPLDLHACRLAPQAQRAALGVGQMRTSLVQNREASLGISVWVLSTKVTRD